MADFKPQVTGNIDPTALVSALLESAQRLGQVTGETKMLLGLDADPFVILPKDLAVTSLGSLIHQDRPRRVIATPSFQTAPSFAAYVNRFHQDGKTVIFADVESSTFHAVIDYHGADAPEHGSHVANYAPAKSLQWTTWAAGSKQAMDQASFAEFIEGARSAIAGSTVPGIAKDLASLLEVTRGLQAKTEVSWSSGVRLKDGSTRLSYTEEVKGTLTNSQLEIPDGFEILLPIFYGVEPIRVACQFRYQMRSGKLTLMYVIHEKAEIEQEAFMAIVREIEAAAKAPVFIGKSY